ncbi:hypothetical protein HBI81_000180 [Parastagonospora nodorum]|nr:hypothetical protein HBH53_085980 [Parastagonospora nodorum]KAH4096274.1 hypothetical protein HBH46_164430 [Parastagonospora nodorum]KAH4195191.1 hypothetical protein HBH42_090170 [Parastagonospora nodorum]KAH5161685.1 hypothetical protein HBH69_028160 [Parastagonospora nodorum]KAH5660743.1 hypothetical protein HBI23_123810 [Parastagonospora nodorum]
MRIYFVHAVTRVHVVHDATEEKWHDAPDSSESFKGESKNPRCPKFENLKPTSSARTLHVSRVAARRRTCW